MNKKFLFLLVIFGISAIACSGGDDSSGGNSSGGSGGGGGGTTFEDVELTSGPSSSLLSGEVFLPGRRYELSASANNAISYQWCLNTNSGADPGFLMYGNNIGNTTIQGCDSYIDTPQSSNSVIYWHAPLLSQDVDIRVTAVGEGSGNTESLEREFEVGINISINSLPSPLAGTYTVSGTLEGQRCFGINACADINLAVDSEYFGTEQIGTSHQSTVICDPNEDWDCSPTTTIFNVVSTQTHDGSSGALIAEFTKGSTVKFRDLDSDPRSSIVKCTKFSNIPSDTECLDPNAPNGLLVLENPLDSEVEHGVDVWNVARWQSNWDTEVNPGTDGTYDLIAQVTDGIKSSQDTRTVQINNDASGGTDKQVLVTSPKNNDIIAPVLTSFGPDCIQGTNDDGEIGWFDSTSNTFVTDGFRCITFSAVVDTSVSNVTSVDFYVDGQVACSDNNGNDADGWSCVAEATYLPNIKVGGNNSFNPIAGNSRVKAYANTAITNFDSDEVDFELLNCGTLVSENLLGDINWNIEDSPYFLNNDFEVKGNLTLDTVTNNPNGNPLRLRFMNASGSPPVGIDVTGNLTTVGSNGVVLEPVTVGTGVPGVDNGYCPGQPQSASTAESGDWGQVKFSAGSSGYIENMVIRYGGGISDLVTPAVEAGLIIESAGELEDGVDLNNDGDTEGSSLIFDGLEIESSNGTGLIVTGSPLITQPTIDSGDLTIKDSTGFGMIMHPAFSGLKDLDSTGILPVLSGNEDGDSIQIEGGNIPQALSVLLQDCPNLFTNCPNFWGEVRWPAVVGAYVVDGLISIEAGASLRLEDGAVVKFLTTASGISSSGRLAVGDNAGDTAYLTSFSDDFAGIFSIPGGGIIDCSDVNSSGHPICDTNKDGISTGSPGEWGSVKFDIGSNGYVENAILRYGGSDPSLGVIQVQSTSLREGSDEIDCDDPDMQVIDWDNPNDPVSDEEQDLKDDCVVIQNNKIMDAGGYGISITGQPNVYPTVRNNIFTSLTTYPVLQVPSYTGISDIQNDDADPNFCSNLPGEVVGDPCESNDNKFCDWDDTSNSCFTPTSSDAFYGIRMLLGRVTDDEIAVLKPMDRGDHLGDQTVNAPTPMPYVVDQDMSVEEDLNGNGTAGIFSILPGVLIKLDSSGGGISAAGTLCIGSVWNESSETCEVPQNSSQEGWVDLTGGPGGGPDGLLDEVVFSAISEDDILGEGDTNGDSSSSSAQPGSWRGIEITSTSKKSLVNNASVRYAGSGLGSSVKIDGSLARVRNSTIENSSGYGLQYRGGASSLLNVTLEDGSIVPDVVRESVKRNRFFKNQKAPLSIPHFSSLCGREDAWTGVNFLEGCDSAGQDQNIVPGPGSLNSNIVSAIHLHTFDRTCPPGICSEGEIAELNDSVKWSTMCFANPGNLTSADCGTSNAGGNVVDAGNIGNIIPYFIDSHITVGNGAELILDYGLVAKFDNQVSGITVNGSLTAAGNPDDNANNPNVDASDTPPAIGGNPGEADVIFTSYFDDMSEVCLNGACDTDGSGLSEGSRGDWKGVYFASNEDSSICPDSYPFNHPVAENVSNIEPCARIFGMTIAFAGAGNRGSTKGDVLDQGNIVFDASESILVDGLISVESAENGIVILDNENFTGSFPTIRNSVFSFNSFYPIVSDMGIGSEFLQDNSYAVNEIPESGNKEYPAFAIRGGQLRNRVVGLDTTWNNNSVSVVGDGGTEIWPMAYVVTDPIRVGDSSAVDNIDVHMRIEEGVVIKMGDPFIYGESDGVDNREVSMIVDGYLQVDGTLTNPVVWTSISDDCNGNIDDLTFSCDSAWLNSSPFLAEGVDTNRDLMSMGPDPADLDLANENDDNWLRMDDDGDANFEKSFWGSLALRTRIDADLNNVKVLFGGSNENSDVFGISPTQRAGNLTLQGESAPGAQIRISDAEFAYSGGHGIASFKQAGLMDINLHIKEGSYVHHSYGRGIHMSETPFKITGSAGNETIIEGNGLRCSNSLIGTPLKPGVTDECDGVFIERTQDPTITGLITKDNGGWGIYVKAGHSGTCNIEQPFPVISSSGLTGTLQVLNNGLGGVRFENTLDFLVDGIEVNNNGYYGKGWDDGHGVDFVVNQIDACPPAAANKGEMYNSTMQNNTWRGLVVRNMFETPTGGPTPDLINNTITGNTGGGILIWHASPTITNSNISNNSALILNDEPLPTDCPELNVSSGNPCLEFTQVGHGVYVHIDRPEGIPTPLTSFMNPADLTLSGSDSTKINSTRPGLSNLNLTDNSPYQMRLPVNIEVGNSAANPNGRQNNNQFIKTVSDSDNTCVGDGNVPCIRNAVEIYGWVISDTFTDDIAQATSDPEAVATTNTYPGAIQPDVLLGVLNGETGGGGQTNAIPYVITNDILILPSDNYEGYSNPADGTQFSPVYLQIDSTIVKLRDEPENVDWSQGAIDFHNHSLFVADNSFITSIHDPLLGTKIDYPDSNLGLYEEASTPGDWGAVRFYNRSLDFWESWLNVDSLCAETDVAVIGGTIGGGTQYSEGFGGTPDLQLEQRGAGTGACLGWTSHPTNPYEGTTADEDEDCDPMCDWYPQAPFSDNPGSSMISRLWNTVLKYGGESSESMIWIQESSPMIFQVGLESSISNGIYIDGTNTNHSFQDLQACSSPGCQIPALGGGGRFWTTFPRIQLASWQSNLLGVCKFVDNGGINLVANANTICSQF